MNTNCPGSTPDCRKSTIRTYVSTFGSMKLTVRCDATAGLVTVRKKIRVSKRIIMPHEYREFMEFCMKIKDAEYRNLSAGL